MRATALQWAGMVRVDSSSGPELVEMSTEAVLRTLEDALEAAGASPAGDAPVTLPAAALSAGAFDAEARPVAADGRFAGADPTEAQHAVAAWLRGPRTVALTPIATRGAGTSILLIGRPADAQGWGLADDLQEIARAPGASAVALSYRPFDDPALADRAAASWRLTHLETRTVLGLVAAGDLKAGARAAGVNYETARKAFRQALRKAGAARQADLVRLLHAAVGGGHVQLDQAPELAAALQVSERAAGVALLVALGLTRGEVAATLGVGESTVKDELRVLFERLRLRSATDLSRVVTEATVLAGLVRNPNARAAANWSAHRPLRFVNRPDDGGRIALSDFGPASGEPALLFHTSTTGLVLDRGLVRALQRRGLRPIAIERPGFGLTDPPAQPAAGAEAALQDVLTVMDALGLKRVRILSRGGEHVALAFAQRHPEKLVRGLLINPFTPQELDRPRSGILNQAKRALMHRPYLLAPVARMMAQRATPAVIAQMTRNAVVGSPTDLAILERPEVMEDYVESTRVASLRGIRGFVDDQQQLANWRPPVLADGSAWTRIIGEQDVLHRPAYADAMWELTLPGHRCVRAPDGGRFLHASHPDLVADEMAR